MATSLYVAANETTLYLDDWRNGSLFQQISPLMRVYPGNDNSQNLNLTIFPNNLASLTFDASSNTTASSFALSEALFDPNSIQVAIRCIHPLSGQYDTLSRALFYLLLVFSLIFRRHVWISVAALGTAMTYAATSAVHLFALISNFGFELPGGEIPWNQESSKQFGDVDFFGIFPLLTAAGIMVTPILMWSTSVRKHHAQAVIIYWGILIFAALVSALYIILKIVIKGWSFNVLPSFALCAKNPYCLSALQPFNVTDQDYSRCNCIDFCGTLGPSAPMRRSANMVAFLHSSFGRKELESNSFTNLYSVNLIALVFIVLYGAVGVLESHSNQEEVRNAIFRFLNADLRMWIKVIFEGEREHDLLARFGMENPDMKSTVWKKCRYLFAKGVATSFFLTAVISAVFCPAVFVTTVVANEIFIKNLPVSEHSDAVGAWGTWVGAALVLIAAVIERYSKAWMDTALIALEASWRVFKYAKKDRPRLRSVNKEWSLRRRIKLFFLEVASPFVHGWYSTWRAFWTAKTNLKFFVAWWKNTDSKSRQTRADINKAWVDERTRSPGGIPTCCCRMCERDAKKNSEGHGEDEPIIKLSLERFRKRMKRHLGEEYDIVQTSSGKPVLTAGSPILLARLSSHPSDGGQSGLDLEGPTTPPSSTGRGRPESELQAPDAAPRPSSPPAAPTHRSTFARRNTDQSVGQVSRKPMPVTSIPSEEENRPQQSVSPDAVTERDPSARDETG